ncbi:MAG: IclR family transcriptional regulator [Kiritimatiellae bacterium]|nr:IclR family transcriptional regulator [Kiritimatiellia bacterium]
MAGGKAAGHEHARYHVPNLDRALSIIECLAEHPNGLTLSEIVRALALPKNSVFRITTNLRNRGYLLCSPESNRFVLSRKFLALGYAAVSEHSLVEKALDVMRDLRDAVRETVLLGTLVDGHGVVLEQVPGLHPFKFIADPGTRLPLHTAAPCKAILAFLPLGERDRTLAGMTLARFNAHTITNKPAFRRELAQIRKLGYAVDRCEQLEGVCCIGAPIFDQHRYPVASIWATGPAERMADGARAGIGREVKRHAARVSDRLGYGALGS